MKLIEDLKSIEDVGTTLVQCFVQENMLTESAARLMTSRVQLLTEDLVDARFPILESVGGQNVKMEVEVEGIKYPFTLYDLIVAYVNYDDFPEPIDMMSALGVPKGEWSRYANPTQTASNRFTRTIFPNALKYDEGRKWIFPKWSDRSKYSEAASQSIHPSKVGYEHGVNAKPSSGSSVGGGGDDVWNQSEMVDGGSRGRKNSSSRVIDSFNKAEIATGEFYNNMSRITPSVWGRIWNREKTSVRSDPGVWRRKWKKIFVLGYQIDRALLYEIWYGTIDGMFTVHDVRGNQLSRKFPTVSEATKALTNAIVQSDSHDAEIFKHGGASANRIAASIVTALNGTTDAMIDDLMKIEQKDLDRRMGILKKREMNDAHASAKWTNRAITLKRKAQEMARDGIIPQSATENISTKDVLSKLQRAGMLSKATYQYLTRSIGVAVALAPIHIDNAVRQFKIPASTANQWKREAQAGRMDIEEFALKLELEMDRKEREEKSVDEMNLTRLKGHSIWSRPKTTGNDNDRKEEYVRPTTVNKHLGFKGMSMARAEREILTSGIPSYADTVGNDINKIRAYIAMLVNTEKYADVGRSRSDENKLIALDVYGRAEMHGSVSSMIKRMTGNTIVRENYNEEVESPMMFDIEDELESRRDSTIGTMRRNSHKTAMSVADLKQAINEDMITLYSETRVNETMWKGRIHRLINMGRKVPIALPDDKPKIGQRIKMFFQGTRYRADFVTGLSLNNRINIEVWYVTEPNPNANVFNEYGSRDADYHGRPTISSFYVFDITSGSLIRKYLPYHKNALQVATAKLGAV